MRRGRGLLFLGVLAVLSCALPASAGDAFTEPGVAHERKRGWRPPTAEEMAWEDANLIVAQQVYLNDLGLSRLNAERRAKGLRPFEVKEVGGVAADGREIRGQTRNGVKRVAPLSAAGDPMAAGPPAEGMAPLDGAAGPPLPVTVDNSTASWFPPVGDQDGLGSCACFSTTYYTMTAMVARVRGWNVRGGEMTNKFSPKFVYNLVNGGGDNGSNIGLAFGTMQSHGAPTWAEWPYDSNCLAWPRTASVWRNAINYRMGDAGGAYGLDGETGLAQIKTLLANGYILNYATFIDGWYRSDVKDNPATTDDNPYVGQKGCHYAVEGSGGHAMTVVGYCDAIWIDVNGNGVIDPGEKGAVRIVNSWGAGWGNGGFVWVSYDALKPTSAVAGGPNPVDRLPAFLDSACYWINARPAHNPVLVAEVTARTAKRDQMYLAVGRSDTSATTPSATWTPYCLNGDGGPLAFDGSTTACDATFVLDLTDLTDTVGSWRWYAKVRDSTSGDDLSFTGFTLVDVAAGARIPCAGTNPSGGLPKTINASTVYAWADRSLSDAVAPAAVTDLAAAVVRPASVTLSWTAPGDDGWSGTATTYDLRYSLSPITEAGWGSATQAAAEPKPGVAGTPQRKTVTGLTPGTTYYVALKTADHASNWSALSNVAQAVTPALLAVATASPMPAAVKDAPYSVDLEAAGGSLPIAWSTVAYAEQVISSAWEGAGTAKGWRADDGLYAYTLPWPFTFYGVAYSSVKVSTNGFLCFDGGDAWWLNMSSRIAIAPLALDLVTTGSGEDVFVTSASDRVVFRWKCHLYGISDMDGAVNFEAVLHKDGRITFNYGSPAIDLYAESAVIGVFKGNGIDFTPSALDGAYGVSAAVSYRFSPCSVSLPPGLSLDPASGLIAGTPSQAGSYTFGVQATDSGTPAQTATQSFSLTVGTSGVAVIASPTVVPVPEGGTATFQVKLSAAPPAAVTVTVARISGDADLSVAGGASLAFTPANWGAWQTVLLAAAEDADVLAGQATIRASGSGLVPADVVAIEAIPTGPGSGFAWQRWDGVSGTAVSNLTSSPDYPNHPSASGLISAGTCEYKPNLDNYGSRLSGFFIAPKTGTYSFFVSSNDASELWLSSDANPANKAKVAYLSGSAPVNNWTTNVSQKSGPIPLVKGCRYYFEALQKEGTGSDDHIQVGVELPGGVLERPIPVHRLDPLTTQEFPLIAGYCLVALGLGPLTPFTAESLAQAVNAQGGSCNSVVRYVGGTFETHPVGTAVNNFEIEPGMGCFLRCAGESRWTMTGYPLSSTGIRLNLSSGYNLIGLPVATTRYTAESAASEINGQSGDATQVIKYENGSFVTHPTGTAVNNFPLVPGEGYFIRCRAASTWAVTR